MHLQHLVPGRFRGLGEGLVEQDAGIVDQDVGAPEVLDGVVTGVSESMVFVQLENCLAEGAVNMRDPDSFERSEKKSRGRGGRSDRWRLNSQTGALVAENGATIQIGDRVSVRLMLVDPPARRMDLRFVERRTTAPPKKQPSPAKPDAAAPSNRSPSGRKAKAHPKGKTGRASPKPAKPRKGSAKRKSARRGKR